MAGALTHRAAHHGGDPFLRLVGFLSQACGVIASLMIVSAIFITCQMIWVRFVMGQSTIWQTEAVVYLMVGATMIGLPFVQYLRGHVNVDLFPMSLPPKLRLALAFLIGVASILIIGVMVYHGSHMWYVAWARGWTSDTVWGVKLWIPYIAVPIGFSLYLLQLAADLYAVARGIEKPFGLDEEGGH